MTLKKRIVEKINISCAIKLRKIKVSLIFKTIISLAFSYPGNLIKIYYTFIIYYHTLIEICAWLIDTSIRIFTHIDIDNI